MSRPPRRAGELEPISNLVGGELRQLIKTGATPGSKLRARLAAAAEPMETQSILYQHTVLCQTCLPHRDPGDEVRRWEMSNGNVHVWVTAGEIVSNDGIVQIGLPFGPKARALLMHINQRALLSASPRVELEETLTRFVRAVLKLDPAGRNMRTVRDQIARLGTSIIKVGIKAGDYQFIRATSIVRDLVLWLPRSEHQASLWPAELTLSAEYFTSLCNHAVPLDEAHICGLRHSSLALDIYAWLAQRLHRIPPGSPVPVTWEALRSQFGPGYLRLRKFRQVFRIALREVLAVYRTARVEDPPSKPPRRMETAGYPIWREDPAESLLLYHSPPPVPPRFIVPKS